MMEALINFAGLNLLWRIAEQLLTMLDVNFQTMMTREEHRRSQWHSEQHLP